MAKALLVYSHGIVEHVVPLADSLAKRGHDLIHFAESVVVGENYDEAMGRTLRTCDALVLFLSDNFAFKNEIEIAQKCGKPVLPVLVGTSQKPEELRDVRAVRLETDQLEIAALAIDRALRAHSVAAAEKAAAEQRAAAEKAAAEQKATAEKAAAEQKAVQVRVETSASDYIKTSLAELRQREKTDRRLGHTWYAAGFGFLFVSMVVAVGRLIYRPKFEGGWVDFAEFAVLGIIAVGLLLALAKYAFTLGKSFMIEALRTADRIHAISFGQFYLNAFGDKAEWQSVKEALQHWNIDRGSAFLSQDPAQFDPKLLESAVEIAKTIAAAHGDAKKKKD